MGASDLGFQLLMEEDVLGPLLFMAKECTVFSLKGVAYFCIGLLSSHPSSLEVLNAFGWETTSQTLGVCLPVLTTNFVHVPLPVYKGSWPSVDFELYFKTADYSPDELKVLEWMGNISNHILANTASKQLNK